MKVSTFYTRHVAVASGGTGVAEAARMMREAHVGDLVVVDEADGRTRPVGIVTDRDLVVEVLATDLDPESVTLADLPCREVQVAREDDELLPTLERMSALGVRRLPVVDGSGSLAGIITVDDVLPLIGRLADSVVALLEQGRLEEARMRP